MPGDPSSKDQAEAQRLVADRCRPKVPDPPFSMAYQSAPVAWSWAEFLRVMEGINGALHDEAFLGTRARFTAAEGPRAQWEALKRLQDPLNKSFKPAGVELLVNDDHSFTVAELTVNSDAGKKVSLRRTDNPELSSQGEHQRQ
jgi:hypothetical protein